MRAIIEDLFVICMMFTLTVLGMFLFWVVEPEQLRIATMWLGVCFGYWSIYSWIQLSNWKEIAEHRRERDEARRELMSNWEGGRIRRLWRSFREK